MAFAVRDALWEKTGRAIWIRWSETSPKYDERTASREDVGRRLSRGRSPRPVCLGLRRRRAFAATAPMRYRRRRARPDSAKAEREAQHRQQRADNAATRAQAMLKQAEWAEHPYLQRKALGRRASGYR